VYIKQHEKIPFDKAALGSTAKMAITKSMMTILADKP
jgi:hypothetical protein